MSVWSITSADGNSGSIIEADEFRETETSYIFYRRGEEFLVEVAMFPMRNVFSAIKRKDVPPVWKSMQQSEKESE